MIYANDNGEDDNKIILHTEDTKVIHGEERVNQIFNNVYQNCNTNFHVSYDKNAPQVIMEASEYSNAYLTLKNKNVKIKSVIDITADNLKYCKQLAELFGAEIRHLEGNKGNFAVADGKEYVATSLALKNTLVSEIIYSNANNVVEQNQFIFDTLWNKAIPVEQRIREIEEGLLPIETKILDTSEEITLHVLELLEKTKVGVSACAPTTAFEVMDNYKPILDAYKALVKKHREGKIQRGVHFLTYIENNNNQVALVKRFLKIGFNIRHLNNSPPFSFIVSEKQLESTIEKMIGGQIATSLLYSTEPLYLQHYQSLFRDLWDSAIEAEERMRQIDQGIASEHTKVIENPIKIKDVFLQTLGEAQEEIFLVFPSFNSIKRQIKLTDLLEQKSKNKDIKIKIMTSMDNNPNKKISLLPGITEEMTKSMENFIVREIIHHPYSNHGNNYHKYIQRDHNSQKQSFQYIQSTILLVDKKHLLAMELKDDSKDTFEEAIGPSTYSTSKPTVLSYLSILENLWNETELLNNLKIANEKLLQSQQMERDFINMVAHELRTPTQTISGYSELNEELFSELLSVDKYKEEKALDNDTKDKDVLNQIFDNQQKVSKNLSRLHILISNLLDVAKIESNTVNFKVYKDKVDLVNLIEVLIYNDIEQKIKEKDIKVNFIIDKDCIDADKDNKKKEEDEKKGKYEEAQKSYVVYADKSRLEQIINNLLDNAIKFSDINGKIDIILNQKMEKQMEDSEKRDDDKTKSKSDAAVVIDSSKVMGEKGEDDDRDQKRDDKSSVFVSIRDNGKSISPEIMPRLFEKFITDSQSVGGTGLGLYITRILVEAHGGKIWAFNNKDSKGATFVFSLPVFK